MKPSHLRHLAVLALLCVLPRLGATVMTISQAASIPITNSVQPSTHVARGSANWLYQPFDPMLGALESVTLVASLTARVSAFDLNLWPAPPTYTSPKPIEVTPFVGLQMQTISIDDPSIYSLSDYASSTGTTVVVPPNGSFHHTADLTVSTTTLYTSPTGLASFSGLMPPPQGGTPHLTLFQASAYGYGDFGGISFSGIVNATITYQYRVTEEGTPIVWFASAFVLFAIARHSWFKGSRAFEHSVD